MTAGQETALVRLADSLLAWGTESFAATLKGEIRNLGRGVLPLDAGVAPGSHVRDDDVTATVLHARQQGRDIHVKLGIFFTEIVGSCGCGDEPMEKDAYCELSIRIDRETAEARFQPFPEEHSAGE